MLYEDSRELAILRIPIQMFAAIVDRIKTSLSVSDQRLEFWLLFEREPLGEEKGENFGVSGLTRSR